MAMKRVKRQLLTNQVKEFFRNSNLQDDLNISSYSSGEEEKETEPLTINVTASQNYEESIRISVDSSFSLCNVSNNFISQLEEVDSTPTGSPVICSGKLEQLSPVLTHKTMFESLSPIISRKQTKKKVRLSEIFTIPEVVHEVASPDIKTGGSSCTDNLVINSFSSDNLDKGVINSASSCTSSLQSVNNKPLYQDTSPIKKRKRHKKDGLAIQLEKALDKQRSDFSIFRHELFLRKTNDKIVIDETSMIIVKINELWKEFGVTMVYCDYLNLQGNIKLVNYFKNQSNDSDASLEHCLVSIGFNVTHSLVVREGAKLKVYLPFKSKVVKYKEVEIYCHFNVFKIFSEK